MSKDRKSIYKIQMRMKLLFLIFLISLCSRISSNADPMLQFRGSTPELTEIVSSYNVAQGMIYQSVQSNLKAKKLAYHPNSNQEQTMPIQSTGKIQSNVGQKQKKQWIQFQDSKQNQVSLKANTVKIPQIAEAYTITNKYVYPKPQNSNQPEPKNLDLVQKTSEKQKNFKQKSKQQFLRTVNNDKNKPQWKTPLLGDISIDGTSTIIPARKGESKEEKSESELQIKQKIDDLIESISKNPILVFAVFIAGILIGISLKLKKQKKRVLPDKFIKSVEVYEMVDFEEDN